MKPLTFNPQPNVLAGLFARWVPLYVKQRPMEDHEAKPLQQELCEIETQIGSRPITSMQDFFYHHTAMTCLGTMGGDYTVGATDAVAALAVAEEEECRSLQAAIAEHTQAYDELNALLAKYDDDDPAFEQSGGRKLADRENDLLFAVARHPARSHETMVLKGRYFAVRHSRGDVDFYQAAAFIASFNSEECA